MTLAQTYADSDRIRLIARDDSANIRRGYQIERSTDLFGHVIIDWHWGRIGTSGQSRRVSFVNDSGATAFVRSLLRRRDGSGKRIGVDYVPITPIPLLQAQNGTL